MKTHAWMFAGVVTLALVGCGGSKEAVKGEPEAGAPAPVATPANAPVLAVSTVGGQNVNKAEAALVTDMIRTELMALGKWRVIDRDHMDEALKGQVLAMAGVTSDTDAVHLGKLLNAQLIGLGTYGQLMGVNVVTFRIVDVETGLAQHAGTAQGKDPVELRKGIAAMVKGFAR
jgi:hypothetical protein